VQPNRHLECLAIDAGLLRDAAQRDLSAAVPTCPGWSAAKLVEHTAEVYLHKAECMRRNAFPHPWPPDLSAEEPIALFDRAHDELAVQFASRDPSEKTVTWYEPDQTVRFWIRRMAQETVIHRVDAQLAASENVDPIPDDLAADGVDEVLVCFLAYATTGLPDTEEALAALPEEVRTAVQRFRAVLKECDGRAVRVEADSRSWLVQFAGDHVVIGDAGADPEATVSGDPADVLLWLWGRVGDDAVKRDGDTALIAKLRELLVAATQ